jgi:hypothetical protein
MPQQEASADAQTDSGEEYVLVKRSELERILKFLEKVDKHLSSSSQ